MDDRNIVWYDLETTGLNLLEDRIVEIYLFKEIIPKQEDIKMFSEIGVNPALSKKIHYYINPGIPIPEEASAIHGITNEKVKDYPTFIEVAQEIFEFIQDCDLGGYNSSCFDDYILFEELRRCGHILDLKTINRIDIFKLWHKIEPRTLTGAYKRFTNKEFIESHSAKDDVRATVEIFNKMKMIEREGKFIGDWTNEEISSYTFEKGNIDPDGKFRLDDFGNILFNFGKYTGKSFEEVMHTDMQYIDWIINKSEMNSVVKYFTLKLKNKFSNHMPGKANLQTLKPYERR